MIHILSEYHAKRKDEKSEHAKDAPHGTDEENHHRQNCQHGQNTTPKGTHETHRHIDHETDQRPLHPIFNALSVASPCSFQGADTDGEKICKAFGEKFSTARLDGLKNFRQNPQGAKRACRFLGAPYVASHPEPRKVELLTG